MKPFDNALRETVFDLIYSGLRRRMTNGDSYGLWVVRDQNDTSFPMDIWRSRSTVEMGVKATAHVKEDGFKGKPRLDLALADALRVARSVGDLTIIIVSNGETPIAGTPFDDAINARFRELAPQMKRAKLTVNTALVARDGALAAWAVNSPDFLIDVPYVEPKPKSVDIQIALPVTNSPAPLTNVVAEASPVPPPNTNAAPLKQRPNVASIIITKETVAQERREFTAMTTTGTNQVGAIVPSTNTDTLLSNSIAEAATTILRDVAIASGSSDTNNIKAAKSVEVAITEPSPKSNNAAASNAVAAAARPPKAPILDSATSSKVAVTPAVPVVTLLEEPKPPQQTTSSFHPVLWVGIGAAAALVCVFFAAVLIVRCRRQEPSLISQAIAQQRAH